MRVLSQTNPYKVIIIFAILLVYLPIPIQSFLSIRKYIHDRWNEQDRKLSEITDITWNYCDVKCTYLQVLFPAHDFVVIYFKDKQNAQQFGVCFIKIDETYFIWNQLVENQFYEKVCGEGDHEDYLNEENKFEMVSIMGIGRGMELPIKYSPFTI